MSQVRSKFEQARGKTIGQAQSLFSGMQEAAQVRMRDRQHKPLWDTRHDAKTSASDASASPRGRIPWRRRRTDPLAAQHSASDNVRDRETGGRCGNRCRATAYNTVCSRTKPGLVQRETKARDHALREAAKPKHWSSSSRASNTNQQCDLP